MPGVVPGLLGDNVVMPSSQDATIFLALLQCDLQVLELILRSFELTFQLIAVWLQFIGLDRQAIALICRIGIRAASFRTALVFRACWRFLTALASKTPDLRFARPVQLPSTSRTANDIVA